jgi:NADH-quinone oxidoreductase subunit F
MFISPGRLMAEFTPACPSANSYVLRSIVREQGRDAALKTLEQAGVRGRGGGGFPTSHKWWLVGTADAADKFFVCNANFPESQASKESWFIRANPSLVVEAVALAAYCVAAHAGYIALPQSAMEEYAALDQALHSAYEIGMLGPSMFGGGWRMNIQLVRAPDAYLAGEETALLEFMEGKPLQPRGKPPLPSSAGLFGKPTAINNLETVLQSWYATKVGAHVYRQVGVPNAPGTLVFTLVGRVQRPGLYELPLGTSLRDLIFGSGEGMRSYSAFKAVFPGGIGSPVLGKDRLETPLDFDSLRDAGSALGAGVVIVLDEMDCMVDVATRLAALFHEASCGKCQPCEDGTARVHAMLTKIDTIEQPGIDISGRLMPPSKRQGLFTIINNGDVPSGISYTDTVRGLDKITHLCEFFQYRGDCDHATEAAASLISLLSVFRDEFDDHKRNGACRLHAANGKTSAMAEVG